MNEKAYIGVRFDVFNSYTDHFSKIFESIDVKDYTWYVTPGSANETLFEGCTADSFSFLPIGVYSGREFYEKIHSCNYYIFLLVMFAVPNGKEFKPDSVQYYEEYVQSNAELAFICADRDVNLYVKNPAILKNIFESCKKYYDEASENEKQSIIYYEHPELFTKEDDYRTALEV